MYMSGFIKLRLKYRMANQLKFARKKNNFNTRRRTEDFLNYFLLFFVIIKLLE